MLQQTINIAKENVKASLKSKPFESAIKAKVVQPNSNTTSLIRPSLETAYFGPDSIFKLSGK